MGEIGIWDMIVIGTKTRATQVYNLQSVIYLAASENDFLTQLQLVTGHLDEVGTSGGQIAS